MTDEYNFQVGERVIDIYGREGTITHICHCDECKKRGFYEFVVEWLYLPDTEDWFTCYNEQKGFPKLHKVGERIFNSLDLENATKEQNKIEAEIKALEEQKRFLTNGINLIKAINRLENNGGN